MLQIILICLIIPVHFQGYATQASTPCCSEDGKFSKTINKKKCLCDLLMFLLYSAQYLFEIDRT